MRRKSLSQRGKKIKYIVHSEVFSGFTLTGVWCKAFSTVGSMSLHLCPEKHSQTLRQNPGEGF